MAVAWSWKPGTRLPRTVWLVKRAFKNCSAFWAAGYSPRRPREPRRRCCHAAAQRSEPPPVTCSAEAVLASDGGEGPAPLEVRFASGPGHKVAAVVDGGHALEGEVTNIGSVVPGGVLPPSLPRCCPVANPLRWVGRNNDIY